MHYRLEVVMPPTNEIKKAIGEIMEPFNEQLDTDDEYSSSYKFWDWWVIGGRFAGRKLEESLDQKKLKEFKEKLNAMDLKVSGLVFGKESLISQEMVDSVDALWRDYFPDCGFDKCPLFQHSNDQYREYITGDVMEIKDLPNEVACLRAIIAGPHWDDEKGGFEAKYMIEDSIWNGVCHSETTWDKTLHSAISAHVESMSRATDEYKEKYLPKDNWLVVTVDYHG